MVVALGFSLLTCGAFDRSAGAGIRPGVEDPVPVAGAQVVSTGVVPPGSGDGSALLAVPPVRVVVPALGVDTEPVALGLQPDGTVEVPDSGEQVGWYTGAPPPGAWGPAVFVGHVDWAGRPGVFHRLGHLRPGAEVRVVRADGSTAVFRVTAVERYPKERFPTEAVYGAIDHAGLRLITCGGRFDRARRSYTDNVVAYAVLVGAEPAERPAAPPAPGPWAFLTDPVLLPSYSGSSHSGPSVGRRPADGPEAGAGHGWRNPRSR